ncbi:MAG: glycosyltransferase family 2 protein [Bacteroidetes bacterium]|nr:glycosyltransferase family 2 protein [Bacteroidota bacterium]
MNKDPLISFIVPCYNDGKFILECLNSIHEQDYKTYEVIIINDGSKDKITNQIVSTIVHPKVKVLQTTNQGPAKARNLGILNSQGKYILPLDADNKIATSFVTEAIAVLENNPGIKIVSCDLKIFGLKDGYVKFATYTLEKLLGRNLMECASIYRREDFDKTKGYNPNMIGTYEDWDLWLSLLENGGEVYQIKKPYIFYRIKKTSRNQSVSSEEHKRLRKQIYLNHQNIYSNNFLDPSESFEYHLLYNSKEYKLGRFLLKPLRALQRIIR